MAIGTDTTAGAGRIGRACRVAVVGGGPGGAHCAHRLAESGVRVTLFEPRSAFEKACGGGVPARALEHYPFLDDPALPKKLVRRCRLISARGRETEFPLIDPLYVFSRADLHSFLLRRASDSGVRIVRSRVLFFDRRSHRSDGVRGGGAWFLRATPTHEGAATTAYGPFDFLVAADGASGGARRRLAGGLRSSGLTQGIGYYMPGLSENAITLKFWEGLNGYLWVFPRPDHSSAGICSTLGLVTAARLKEMMDPFLVERYGRDLLLRSRPYAALIPGAPRDPDSEPVQGDGWAFVGDTGRFVDPLTREGIFYAMLTADLLAGSLLAGHPERYGPAWASGPGREFAWVTRRAERFFDPRFIERLVGLCDLSPRVARVVSDLIAGRQSYRSLKIRLVRNAPVIALQALVRRLGRARRGAGAISGRSVLRPNRGS